VTLSPSLSPGGLRPIDSQLIAYRSVGVRRCGVRIELLERIGRLSRLRVEWRKRAEGDSPPADSLPRVLLLPVIIIAISANSAMPGASAQCGSPS
jgi:hypothetical protein